MAHKVDAARDVEVTPVRVGFPSKAVSMGSAIRRPAAAVAQAHPGARPSPVEVAPPSVPAATQQSMEVSADRDASLDSALQRLGGSITGRKVRVTTSKTLRRIANTIESAGGRCYCDSGVDVKAAAKQRCVGTSASRRCAPTIHTTQGVGRYCRRAGCFTLPPAAPGGARRKGAARCRVATDSE